MSITDRGRTISIVSVAQTTMDMFEFWLNYDWNTIVSEIYPDKPVTFREKGDEQYVRTNAIRWSRDDPEHFNRTTLISWFQTHIGVVQVEINGSGELHDRLLLWLSERFGVTAADQTVGRSTINSSQSNRLTKTEKRVADWLADGQDYQKIAESLGNRTESAAKKHAHSLAGKWGSRQVVEVLQREARNRGYGAAKSDTQNTI